MIMSTTVVPTSNVLWKVCPDTPPTQVGRSQTHNITVQHINMKCVPITLCVSSLKLNNYNMFILGMSIYTLLENMTENCNSGLCSPLDG